MLRLRSAAALLLAATLASAGLHAETCPPPPEHGAALEALIARVQVAPDADAARAVTDEMWALWADAPNAQAQEVLDTGMRKRSNFDFLGAIEEFDRLVAYCPDYAEGYNQRAFVHFIRRDFARALADLDTALALSPRHIAALSGRGLTLMQMGRIAEGQADLRAALAMNPWLPERVHIRPLPPPGDAGRDL